MRESDIKGLLAHEEYDLRLHKDGTWIDQKCTPDITSYVADCILNYVLDKEDEIAERGSDCCKEIEFTIKDIELQKYSNDSIGYFGKPDVEYGSSEYDKVFSQPIKMLNYAHVLKMVRREKRQGRPFVFIVNNRDMLEYIASGEKQAFSFLCVYVERVLRDSNAFKPFGAFFESQTEAAFSSMKKSFFRFLKKNTPRGGSKGGDERDCNRIFTKALNTLAYANKTKGTEGGNLSNDIIQWNDLLYNRKNFYDEYTGKPKGIKRTEYDVPEYDDDKKRKYAIEKAKNKVRSYNRKNNNGKSECYISIAEKIEGIDEKEEQNEICKQGTQIHHIFRSEEYPDISAHVENLISLSPNQHVLKAHPGNKTKETDRLYQYYLLLCKMMRIQTDEKGFYSREKFIETINVGFHPHDYSGYEDKFDELAEKIKTEEYSELFNDKTDEEEKTLKSIVDLPVDSEKNEGISDKHRHCVVSLFAGCGGLDFGFEQAGFTVSCAVENDRKLWETYEYNHPNTKLYRCGIHQVTADMIRESVGGEIEGVIAGLPIQSESISVGGGDKYGGGALLTEYFRLLKGLNPKFFWINSVSAITKVNNGKVVEKIVEMANDAGYDATYYIVNAKDFNTAQNRKIFICVGFRKGLGIDFKIPAGSTSNSEKLTLRDAIEDLQETAVPAGARNHHNPNASNNNEYYNGSFSSFYMSANRVKSWDEQGYAVQASGCMNQIHPQAPKMVQCGHRRFKFVEEKEKLYRRITIREAARLQGFPDEYRFVYNNVETGYMMVGHALPINVAYEIASEIMQLLNT